jgi:hypothetical protein
VSVVLEDEKNKLANVELLRDLSLESVRVCSHGPFSIYDRLPDKAFDVLQYELVSAGSGGCRLAWTDRAARRDVASAAVPVRHFCDSRAVAHRAAHYSRQGTRASGGAAV